MKLSRLLESHGVDYKQTSGSAELRVRCPFCGDQKYRLYLNGLKRQGICFKCTESGGVWKFLRQLGVINSVKLGEDAGAPTEKKTVAPPSLPTGAVRLVDDTDSLPALLAWDYLLSPKPEGRALKEQEVADYEIHYCPSGDLIGNIVLPCWDEERRLTGYQARKYMMAGPKSMNPPDFNDRMFNLHRCAGRKKLLIVEGPFDAIVTQRHLADAGVGTLSLLGHSISNRQATHIAYVLEPETVWIMLDPDAVQDQRKIAKAIVDLGIYDVRLCNLRDGDPDELTPEQLKDQLGMARRYP